MLLHLLKKVVEYDKYEVCPRIDFPVPQFVLPTLWLNFKCVFNLSIVAVSYLIPLGQLCQPMLIFAINFNPLEILERIALSRGADTFFPFDDGRFFGNINKGFPPSRLRARLTLAYKNWQEGSLNREGWGKAGPGETEESFVEISPCSQKYLLRTFLFILGMDLDFEIGPTS